MRKDAYVFAPGNEMFHELLDGSGREREGVNDEFGPIVDGGFKSSLKSLIIDAFNGSNGSHNNDQGFETPGRLLRALDLAEKTGSDQFVNIFEGNTPESYGHGFNNQALRTLALAYARGGADKVLVDWLSEGKASAQPRSNVAEQLKGSNPSLLPQSGTGLGLTPAIHDIVGKAAEQMTPAEAGTFAEHAPGVETVLRAVEPDFTPLQGALEQGMRQADHVITNFLAESLAKTLLSTFGWRETTTLLEDSDESGSVHESGSHPSREGFDFRPGTPEKVSHDTVVWENGRRGQPDGGHGGHRSRHSRSEKTMIQEGRPVVPGEVRIETPPIDIELPTLPARAAGYSDTGSTDSWADGNFAHSEAHGGSCNFSAASGPVSGGSIHIGSGSIHASSGR